MICAVMFKLTFNNHTITVKLNFLMQLHLIKLNVTLLAMQICALFIPTCSCSHNRLPVQISKLHLYRIKIGVVGQGSVPFTRYPLHCFPPVLIEQSTIKFRSQQYQYFTTTTTTVLWRLIQMNTKHFHFIEKSLIRFTRGLETNESCLVRAAY